MKVLAKNKRAYFDYDIEDTFVAGIILRGPEVKSVKQRQVSLKGSYVTISGGEAYLINAHIAPYQHASQSPDPRRRRKLLLHKTEIQKLVAAKQNNRTIVPLKIGLIRGLIKLEIGIARGRKKHDKREYIKKRDQQREVEKHVHANI